MYQINNLADELERLGKQVNSLTRMISEQEIKGSQDKNEMRLQSELGKMKKSENKKSCEQQKAMDKLGKLCKCKQKI